jgi:hypothetical protein
MRLTPGFLEVPDFELTGDDLSGQGWAAADLSDRTVAGAMHISEDAETWLELSGPLDSPEWQPVAPLPDPEVETR